MSTSKQDKSITQQRDLMVPKAKLEGVAVVQEFKDEALSGDGMNKRDGFLTMLEFCRKEAREGRPVDCVVVYHCNRFSRATSTETSWYVWEFQKAGVHRILTSGGWRDFRKESDRILFNIEQDATNHRHNVDLAAGVLRGKMSFASMGYFVGGSIPYGFDRLLLDAAGNVSRRVPRGVKIGMKEKGWRFVLAPIPEDDPDPARQLERQTAVWIFRTYLSRADVSYRGIAHRLNDQAVPAPGGGKWTCVTVRGILKNPVYMGVARMGKAGRGKHFRMVKGKSEPVDPGARRTDNAEGLMMTRLEHGGLVDEATFQAVQKKLAARTKSRVLSRGAGYLIPSGIMHCGHCGCRMYGCVYRRGRGRKAYRYLKYTCSGPKVKPGTCQSYALDEHVIVKALVDKLLSEYLSGDRLTKLEAKLREKAESRHQGAPQQAGRLRARLEGMDKEIRQAVKNLLRCPDNVDLLNEELARMRSRRDEAARELAAAERDATVPEEEVSARVQEGIGNLYRLRDELRAMTPKLRENAEKFREVVKRLCSRVDLFFEAEARGRRLWYRCVRGIVKLRPVLTVSGSGTDGS
jgi:hypothetical protein